MDSHSEPIAATAAYDLVISDDVMSVDTNLAAPDPHVRGIDKDIPLVSTTLPTISTTHSMENVLLDTLPMDESIDLGSDSAHDRSVHSAASMSGLAEEPSEEAEENGVKTEEVTSPEQQLHEDDTTVHFDDIVAGSDETDKEPTAQDLLIADIESLLRRGSTEHGTESVQITEAHSESEDKLPKPDDAHEVEFVEEKGLQAAESSRSLCKFFENEDNVGGTDVEGKSFFDSFTTGDEDPITPTITPSPKISEPAPTLPPLSMPYVSLSSSLSTPSPVRRLSESSSPYPSHCQNSVSEGSVSQSDPFSAGMFINDADRRNDAWIPPEATRLVLVSVLTNAPGTPLLAHQSCSPCIMIDESLVCNYCYLCEFIVLIYFSYISDEKCCLCKIIKKYIWIFVLVLRVRCRNSQ